MYIIIKITIKKEKQRSDTIIVNDTKRVFIAINLDWKIKKYLTNIQEYIRKYEDARLKMKSVKSKNLHISLKFLGDLNSLEIEKTLLALQKISFQYQPFEIDLLKRIGVFPSPTRPRVIWIGIEKGGSEVEKIYHAIEQELREEPFYRYNKKFTTHITLGRVKYLKYPNKLIEAMKNIKFENISQTIHSIELMESHLTPQGPIYTVISHFPLLQ